MSYHTQPIPTTSQGIPGSMQYGMDHGRCYDVNGINKYGRLVCDADSHLEAAQIVLYKGETYSVWVPNDTLLTVYRVGPRDYMRSDKQEYRVWCGEAVEVLEMRAAA